MCYIQTYDKTKYLLNQLPIEICVESFYRNF